jgi:hypothetical protein
MSTARSAPYHPAYDIFNLNNVCDEYAPTKSGGDNGTSIAFQLLQLHFITYSQPYDRL